MSAVAATGCQCGVVREAPRGESAARGAGEPHSRPFFGLRLWGSRDQTSGIALKGMESRTSMDDGWGKGVCSEKSRASEWRGGAEKCSRRQKGRRQRKGYLGRGNSTSNFTFSSWSGPMVLCNFLSKFMVTSSVIALDSEIVWLLLIEQPEQHFLDVVSTRFLSFYWEYRIQNQKMLHLPKDGKSVIKWSRGENNVRTRGAWFKRAGVTLLGRTLCRQSGRGASRAGSVHLSSKRLVGRRSADTQQAGTFRLSMNPRALYVPCVTCIFSSRSFLTLVLMSYNLCDNASMYFARQNSGWFNLDSMPS